MERACGSEPKTVYLLEHRKNTAKCVTYTHSYVVVWFTINNEYAMNMKKDVQCVMKKYRKIKRILLTWMAACIGCVVSTWIWILCAIWILLLLTACAKKIVTGMKAEKERACERERERRRKWSFSYIKVHCHIEMHS